MLFAAVCLDKPDSLQIRMQTRPSHLDFLKAHAHCIPIGGPLLMDDGETPKGSLLVVEADDAAAASAILDRDPYALAGLFASVTLTPWKWVVGAPAA
ncbi:MAG: YciI family protein [Rhodobiaceae bacterium]|nr:YciI family protein [Rhodobiaceae bacterium]MCC0016180.1 YciI family protein [Rhodobiaceae bacterium]MCC0041215.1 YciI family protein [Rhodobiaceae bacterium]